ncbi:MAG TPA: aminotransferase [Xanthobacteraceae bacterium]
MTYIPNSIEARDIASLVHMQTNLRLHQQEGPLVIARGDGCRVFDEAGRDYIESVAGLWCASLGFGSERLAKVAHEQMRRLGYYHLYRHRSNEPAIALAETLLRIAPVPMARVLFQCSGSEANDTAIKLAWYYWHARGEPQRVKIIARQMAYHGNTCAAVSLSGKPDMHAGFGLPFAPFKHTEFPHYYRRHEPGESETEFSTRMAHALDRLIQAEGPETVAAFFAEPIMGAGGAILPPDGYFEKIQAVLRQYDILFVADEVICGFARTGEMWGSQTYSLRPDMITAAKALSAAMQPISAVLVSQRVHDAMLAQSDRFGNFAHGYTYAGHPVACAVALEVQKIYAEIDIVARARRLGPLLQSTLGRLRAHPLVGDVRGTGLILGIELMRDGERRIAFDAALKVGARVEAAAKRHGLILRVVGDRLVFAPPLVIEAPDIEQIGIRLARALDDAANDLKREGVLH